MATRNILKDGDATLLKKSRTVTDFNERLHVLLDDMRQTLIEANGLGLAAPQVGVLRRVALVVDTSIEKILPEDQITELVNPEIVEQSGEQTDVEGCLSVPEVFGMVTRPDFVKVRAQDRNGNVFEFSGEALTARALCHELDHLDGVLFKAHVEKLLTEEDLQELYAERAKNDGEPTR